MTKSGIERDLSATPYSVTIKYEDGHMLEFMFSSKHGMRKFEDEVEANRKRIKESLSNRFKMNFKIANDFCDIILYRQLERRGFRIVGEWGETLWPGKLEYNGTRVVQVS